MRVIRKGEEPKTLTEHRNLSHASYANYPDKEGLRAALTAEQRGVCCYCLSRIPGARGMKIEHWRSQREFPEAQLDYANLLGACGGNQGQVWEFQHCDTRKGDRRLSRSPANSADRVDDLILYLADGRIVSRNQDFDRELNEILNLNEAHLKNNRKATLDAFLLALPKTGGLPAAKLRKWLALWNGELDNGDLKPFCQVVVYWLQKRLARA